jgi:hypothetical protein
MTHADPTNAWIDAVIARHTQNLSAPEFLKAVRALSARYVERRDELGRRSPTDSAGKRAAFAGFFGPIHFLTARAIAVALDAGRAEIETIVDLGCGTGVVGAAWAMTCARRPRLIGIDREGWALTEAAWTWRHMGLDGRTKRADLIDALDAAARPFFRHPAALGIVLGWSANELDERERAALLPRLVALAERGASVLVIEPIARAAVPWWDDWAGQWTQSGGRSDLWKLDERLPSSLERLSEAAGFRREGLTARTLWR